MNRKIIAGFVFLCFSLTASFGQTVYMPPSHEIYSFLKRMESRQLLTEYRDAAKPLSRMTLAKMLKSLEPQAQGMTRVERETYEFLVTEFKYELLKLAGDAEPTEVRWHLFSTEITKGVMNFDINFKLSKSILHEDQTNITSKGVTLYGYAFENVGYYFNWIDNLESGRNVNYNRIHTSTPGAVPNRVAVDPATANIVFEHNENNVQVTWQTGDFSFSLEKNNNIWGYGRNGNVIFSNKAPSYPQIKMRVPISDKIDFVYFHGELNSNEIDSSRSYFTHYQNSAYSVFREVDRSKYIAAHQLEISLFKGVDLSIGESVIYSDRGPLLIYMIPIMFFKAGEWYNRDKDNCQMFGSLDLNLIKNVNAYFSLIIDEINTDNFFDPNASRRQIAFTSGFQFFDIPATNMDLVLEYTRANPWVYNHKYTAVNFTNNGYDLGHWIGQNADDIYIELGLTPIHALRIGAFCEVYRKGGKADISNQYAADGGGLPFLYDLQHEERSFGLLGRYQPLRDVFFDFRIKVQNIEDKLRPSTNQNNQVEYSIDAGVGIW
jgi:hypothetical protein